MEKMLKYLSTFLVLLFIIIIYFTLTSAQPQIKPAAIIKNISVEGSPSAVAVTPDGQYVYVTSDNTGTVSVISTTNNTVIKTIQIGKPDSTFPEGIAITPNGAYAYIADSGTNNISVISTENNTVIRNITTDGNPWWVTINKDGQYAYVSNQSGSIYLISIQNNTIVDTINVGGNPLKSVLSFNGEYLYVPNCCINNGTISVISTYTDTVLRDIKIGGVSGMHQSTILVISMLR